MSVVLYPTLVLAVKNQFLRMGNVLIPINVFVGAGHGGTLPLQINF